MPIVHQRQRRWLKKTGHRAERRQVRLDVYTEYAQFNEDLLTAVFEQQQEAGS